MVETAEHNMAFYEWVCRECDIFWDRDCQMGKAPNRTKCPKCKKLSGRYYENANVSVSFKDDGYGNGGLGVGGANDFHTVRRRYQKVAENGFDKDSANRFLRKSIEQSKLAAADESFRYKPMHLKYDKLAQDRGVKKVSASEVERKIQNAKKLTEEAYDRANKLGYRDVQGNKLDVTKPQKQQ
jgi:rubrerythrin